MDMLTPLLGGGAAGAIATGAPTGASAASAAAAGSSSAGTSALMALQFLGTGMNIFGSILEADIRSTQIATEGLVAQGNAQARAAEARMQAVAARGEAAGLRAQATSEAVAAKAERVAAEQELVKGREESNAIRRALMRNLASNRAAMAASGLDVASSTASVGEVVASKEAGRARRGVILDSSTRARVREIEGGNRLIRKGMFEFGASSAEAGARAAESSAGFLESQAGMIPSAVRSARSFVEAGGLMRASLSLADLTRSFLQR